MQQMTWFKSVLIDVNDKTISFSINQKFWWYLDKYLVIGIRFLSLDLEMFSSSANYKDAEDVKKGNFCFLGYSYCNFLIPLTISDRNGQIKMIG